MCLAIPGKLMQRSDEGGVLIGTVQFGGIQRKICLDFLPEAAVGDYVLVHVGFAISRIDEDEACKSYEYLEQAGLIDEEFQLMSAGAAADPSTEGTQ